jgi:hypothetical protein
MKKIIAITITVFLNLCFLQTFAQNMIMPTDAEFEALAKIASSQQFIDINNRLVNVYTSPEKRTDAMNIANVNEFKRLGGQVCPELRICLRDFESTSSPSKSLNFVDFDYLEKLQFNRPINGQTPIDYSKTKPAGPSTTCYSVGIILCVSEGHTNNTQISPNLDPGVQFDPTKYNESKSILAYLKTFASKSEFQLLLQELYSKSGDARSKFVHDVIINPGEIAKRGIIVPNDIIIQRTAFADNRPTLFCLTKYKADGITKLTITYDAPL